MSEWSKETVCKTEERKFHVGSNPSPVSVNFCTVPYVYLYGTKTKIKKIRKGAEIPHGWRLGRVTTKLKFMEIVFTTVKILGLILMLTMCLLIINHEYCEEEIDE